MTQQSERDEPEPTCIAEITLDERSARRLAEVVARVLVAEVLVDLGIGPPRET